jgi:hypothetical protein
MAQKRNPRQAGMTQDYPAVDAERTSVKIEPQEVSDAQLRSFTAMRDPLITVRRGKNKHDCCSNEGSKVALIRRQSP